MSEYSLTLPYYVCQEWGNQCVAGCHNDNICASSCRQDHPCGALNPQRANSSTTTSATASSTASQTSGQVFTGVLGATTSSEPGKGAAPRMEVGRLYGLCVVLGSLFVGFALL